MGLAWQCIIEECRANVQNRTDTDEASGVHPGGTKLLHA